MSARPSWRSGVLCKTVDGVRHEWRCWAVGEMVFTESRSGWGLPQSDFVDSLNDSGTAKAKRLYAAKLQSGYTTTTGGRIAVSR